MSLNDNIRKEFKAKIAEKKFSEIIIKHELKESVLISAIESLLPDNDWKEKKDDIDGLIRINRNKLINNINANTNTL